MGRPLKIKSPDEMEQLWEDYKIDCDNQKVITHDFSSKNSEFVSAELRRSITYTVEGFCIFIKISRQQFYGHYADMKRYADIVTRIRDECEVDARKKFELQMIPTQLAGLWMSKYGYSTKTDEDKKEQKIRMDVNQAKIGNSDGEEQEDDGFLDALRDCAEGDWTDGEEEETGI